MNDFLKLFSFVAVFSFLQFGVSRGAGVGPEREALDAFREQLVKAVSENDLDGILAKLHPDVIVTWQDGQVCRGREEVREFYEKMEGADKKAFQGYITPPTPDENTILYSGNTSGVVYGYNVGRFFLAGKEMELKNRWTATLVKEDGEWMMASYHVSMNILDNPLLNGVKAAAMWGVPGALVLGGVVGFLLRRRKRRVRG
ncbi:YybH family protein [Luteolibacter sp. AS25]|uniref:YybH family protein n=1 Tax=Luteolibacter sp. AS25 TaxID=3135776 RepID=UPI00398AC1DB